MRRSGLLVLTLGVSGLVACGASAKPAPADGDQVMERPGCEGALIPGPQHRFFRPGWRGRSVAVGSVRLLEARALRRPGLAQRVRGRALKIPALVPPSRVLTIELGAGAGFVREPKSLRAYRTIRLEDCPSIPREDRDRRAGNRYVVPLFVVLRRDACGPLTVTRDQGPPRRRLLSLGAGDCRT